ncbi:hypothetical protein PMAYCL1PPCAC_22796, partial [Pristionchus mayeri]
DEDGDYMSPDEALLQSRGGAFTTAGYGSPIEDPNEDYEEDEEEDSEDERRKRPRSSSLASTMFVPRNSVCERATQNTIQSETSVEFLKNGRKTKADRQFDTPDMFARALNERLTGPWLQHTFKRRECIRYVPVEGCVDRCGCGRSMALHCQLALSRFVVNHHRGSSDGSISSRESERWSILTHTRTYPTDAFGTISFQGGAHSHKAHYLRLTYDSAPEDIMYVFEKIWGLQPPRLIITVHGGMSNFEIQEKLGKQFREGLFKAAQTTGAWIITSGVDSGVVKHVAMALDEAGITARMRSKIVTIGIAPWGALRRKERLVGMGINVNYDAHSFSKRQGLSCLNAHHSYFLLADNGTTGRHGADLKLRTRFEEYLASLKMAHGTRGIPIVCTVLEGGTHTINSVHKYLTNEPRVPVIICDGSGRASDIMSFAARYVDSEGVFPDEIRSQLLSLISSVFPATPRSAEQILHQIVECATQIDLLTIFRYGEEQQREDVDHAILTAILRRQNISLPDKLSFCLAWNRVDVARACFATSNEHLQTVDLYPAMVEALRLERVDFLECLLEHGVSMKKFLTISRLEHLYNLDDRTSHSIRYLSTTPIVKRKISIPVIGAIVENLMGGNYRSYYTSRNFRNKYNKNREKMPSSTSSNSLSGAVKKMISSKTKRAASVEQEDSNTFDFAHPFNELMIWAILTRRPDMARCMWLHGEDSMAKSLSAIRLYKSIANLAEREYVEVDTATMLRAHAKTFTDDSIALLDCCYQADDESTLRLLTAELSDWGNHTCLSLAVLANNKKFLAHECCQMLLAEQWHGSLKKKSNSNLRVVAAILLPLTALFLTYKNEEESITPRMREGQDRSRHHSSSSSEESDGSPYSSKNPYRSRQSAQSKASLMNRVVKFISNPFSRWTEGSRAGSVSLISGMEGNFKKKKRVNFDSTSNISAATTYSAMVQPQVQMSKLARIRAFYSAPICKFWTWCISFHIWLVASIYTLLIETPLRPTRLEFILLIYITIYGAEYVRKFLICDQPSMKDKLKIFFSRYWNILTVFALVMYLTGFGLRCLPYTKMYGRVFLNCSNVLWHVKVLDYLSIHPKLGPWITMAGKMTIAMMYMIILLLVPLCAFGVVRQSITYPKEKFEWLLVRNIFYKPYFMLYGEVYAGEIDTCNDEDVNCVTGGFLPPLLMTMFLLVANILLINMLIAIFNNIFNAINAQAQEVWLFQQYSQLLEYNETPTLPPPFTLITHLTQLGILVLQRCCRTCKTRSIRGNRRVGILDVSMKLYLSDEEMRVLHDFEEDCIDELTRKRTEKFDMSGEERWLAAVRQTDVMSQRVSDLVQENFALRNRIWDMESRLADLVKGQQILYAGIRSNRPVEEPRPVKSTLSESTQSLPEKIEESKDFPRRHYTEYTSITDTIRLIPCPIVNKHQPASTLLKNLQIDATMRKYDEAAGLKPITRRRLNSSSVSIAQDMKEMEKESAKHRKQSMTSVDFCLADVVIEGQEWEPPTKEQVAAITAHLSSAPAYEPMANASPSSSSPSISHRPSPIPPSPLPSQPNPLAPAKFD